MLCCIVLYAGIKHVCGYEAKAKSRFQVSETISLVLHFTVCEWISFITKWVLKAGSYVVYSQALTFERSKVQPTQVTMSSSEGLNPDDHKKVHWAFHLEEILYFTPSSVEYEETEAKASHSILKKLKIKARALKNKRFLVLLDNFERDLLHRLQETFERIVGKHSGRYGTFNLEDLKDLNKYWDELFDLYGEYKPNFQELT